MFKNFFSDFLTPYGQYLLFGCLLLALSPYFYLSGFAHPIADDYCYSRIGQTTELLPELWHQYVGWNGRYLSNVFVLLNPLVFDSFLLYKVSSSFQLLLSLLAIYYLLRNIFNGTVSPLIRLNASMLLLLTYLFQMPSLAEGIYWYTGAVSYQMGISFSLFYFGLLLAYFNENFFLGKTMHFICALAMLVIASGFNEVLTLLLVSFHLLALFCVRKGQKRISPEWFWLAGFSLICLMVMAFAPGNNVRESYFPDNHNIIRSLTFTGMQIIRFGFEWVAPLLLASVIFAVLVASLNKGPSFFDQKYFFAPWVSALILSLILFLCIFPAYWGTNILGQHRTVNVACFFFVLYWFICVGVYANRYSEKVRSGLLMNRRLQILLATLMLGILLLTKNGYAVCTDILYARVGLFDEEMRKREDVLRNLQNTNETAHVKALSEKPRSLFVLDLSPDSTYWINSCQASYFGIPAIVCKK